MLTLKLKWLRPYIDTISAHDAHKFITTCIFKVRSATVSILSVSASVALASDDHLFMPDWMGSALKPTDKALYAFRSKSVQCVHAFWDANNCIFRHSKGYMTVGSDLFLSKILMSWVNLFRRDLYYWVYVIFVVPFFFYSACANCTIMCGGTLMSYELHDYGSSLSLSAELSIVVNVVRGYNSFNYFQFSTKRNIYSSDWCGIEWNDGVSYVSPAFTSGPKPPNSCVTKLSPAEDEKLPLGFSSCISTDSLSTP